jgi:APA family basic amino acid/polyamine antiporter
METDFLMSQSPATTTRSKIGLLTATTIVVANMIGTGVFTSIGFQSAGIPRPVPLLLLWIIGGVLALCGAFAYGELGSAFPRSGGEYHYLSRIYHPLVGFLSGWVSSTIGFAAPIALASMAFGQYFHSAVPFMTTKILATMLIVIITGIHCIELRIGGGFQRIITLVEIALISVFIFCGFTITPHRIIFSLLPSAKDIGMIFCPAFAVSLVYVSYAYSGWNGSTYLAGEIKDPAANVPKSIILGTSIVLVLYVLLNFVFLRSTPIAALSGKLEVGLIAAEHIFGVTGGKIMGIFIALCLVSTISSMVIAGPRILKVMGEDYPRLGFFSRETSRGIPWVAIITQTTIALILLWTSTFEKILVFVGFTLTLFTSISVLGVFVLRLRARKTQRGYFYKTSGYPVTPVLFLALNAWMLFYLLKVHCFESIAGLGIVALGVIVYFISKGPEK